MALIVVHLLFGVGALAIGGIDLWAEVKRGRDLRWLKREAGLI